MAAPKLRRCLGSLLALSLLLVPCRGARAFDVVLSAQGEFLDAYLVNGGPLPPKVVFIDPDPPAAGSLDAPPRVGRHVNGKLCFFPRGFGHPGQFVIADDTYREACVASASPQARCRVRRRRSPLFVGQDPDGWGIFNPDGTWSRQQLRTPRRFSDPEPQGAIDPQGCAFDRKGRLWTNDVGHGGAGSTDGSLIVFFPGRDRRYRGYCFLDKKLASPGMPAIDDAGNVYVPEPGMGRILKFSPPFPSRVADCHTPERLVGTPPEQSVFLTGAGFPASIVRVPGTDHWYVGSVIFPPRIDEYDSSGALVRNIVPALVPKNPLGMDVGSDGTLYYAELDLDPVTFDTRCGSVSMVRFGPAGDPMPPELLGRNLRFPDGVTVVDSSQLAVDVTGLPVAAEPAPATCGGGAS